VRGIRGNLEKPQSRITGNIESRAIWSIVQPRFLKRSGELGLADIFCCETATRADMAAQSP